MTIKDLWQKLVSQLCIDVAEACSIFDASVTSWTRSEQRNQAIDGSNTSWHLDSLAFDCILDSTEKAGAFKEYLQNRNYRILDTGGTIKTGRSFHVQYPWIVFRNFKRVDKYSHLREMVKRYSFFFEEFGQIELEEK